MGVSAPKTERNAAILAQYRSGLTMAKIGRDHGISAARIRQIVLREIGRSARESARKKDELERAENSRKTEQEWRSKVSAAGLNRIRTVDLPLSVRSEKRLIEHGYFSLADIANATDYELLSMPGFGRKSLNEVRAITNEAMKSTTCRPARIGSCCELAG